MQNKAFSKIGVLIILVAIIGGGYFSWQYFGTPEEVKVPEEKTSKPYIHLDFPNGGEVWEVGGNYNITWQSKNIEKVDIVVVTTVNDFYIAKDIEATEGSYSWTIPEFWKPTPEGEVLMPADKYKIQVGNCKLPTGESVDWSSFIETIGEECNFDESDNYLTIVE